MLLLRLRRYIGFVRHIISFRHRQSQMRPCIPCNRFLGLSFQPPTGVLPTYQMGTTYYQPVVRLFPSDEIHSIDSWVWQNWSNLADLEINSAPHFFSFLFFFCNFVMFSQIWLTRQRWRVQKYSESSSILATFWRQTAPHYCLINMAISEKKNSSKSGLRLVKFGWPGDKLCARFLFSFF